MLRFTVVSGRRGASHHVLHFDYLCLVGFHSTGTMLFGPGGRWI